MKKILLALLLPIPALSQPLSKEINEKIQRVENSLAPTTVYGDSIPNWNIEERMKQTGIRGLSIAVIRNYKIDWAKGYGWADVDEKRKVNTNTRFQAASISKSINSLGVLKLVEQGKLDTGADINNYLKSWKFPYDSISKNKKITINHLLSHTAGLSIHGFPGYKRDSALPSIQQVLNGERPANTRAVRSMFAPGLRFQYSGGGTSISQLIVSDITGKPYDQYMQETVLKPLGMNNSSFRQPPVDTTVPSTGYYRNGKAVRGKFHVYPEQAAAGLWTSPSDLAKYIIECQLAYEGKSKKILSQSMMKARMTPYIDKNAALGVFVIEKGGIKYFNHNGGNEAFLCTSYGSLSGGNGVVIMINGDDFSVIEELLNSVARVYNWKDFYQPSFKAKVKVPRDSLQLLVGRYQLMKDTLSISFCGEELCIQQNNEPPGGYQMYFSDNSNFTIKEVADAQFRVLKNAEGKVEALQLKQGAMTIRVVKLD